MIGRIQGIAITWALSFLIAGAVAPSQAGGEPGVVSALRANGAAVLALGARGGLDGYFVTPSEGAGYGLYVTGDGHAVAGLLYGPDGTDITGAQLAAAQAGEAPAADAAAVSADAGAEIVSAHAATDPAGTPPASRAVLFERSVAAFGFSLGERGPHVVLFGDPACRWSRSAAARLGPGSARRAAQAPGGAGGGARCGRGTARGRDRGTPRSGTCLVRGYGTPGRPARRRKNRPQQRALRRHGARTRCR